MEYCHAYELVGGLFAKEFDAGAAGRRLVTSWLPSCGAGETQLVLDSVGVRIKGFAPDSARNLIVILEHRPPVGPIASLDAVAGPVAPHLAARNPV